MYSNRFPLGCLFKWYMGNPGHRGQPIQFDRGHCSGMIADTLPG